MYSFKCGDDVHGDDKNELKGISKYQTKHTKFEEKKTFRWRRISKKK